MAGYPTEIGRPLAKGQRGCSMDVSADWVGMKAHVRDWHPAALHGWDGFISGPDHFVRR